MKKLFRCFCNVYKLQCFHIAITTTTTKKIKIQENNEFNNRLKNILTI